MALQTLNTIKQWFKTGLKPTQTQFWDTWDSFRHKFEKVPIKDIEGIDELLLTKADKTILDNHLADKIAHAPQVNTDWNSESGISQLINKPEFKTINGDEIVGSGDIVIDTKVYQTLQDVVTQNGNLDTTSNITFSNNNINNNGVVVKNQLSSRKVIMHDDGFRITELYGAKENTFLNSNVLQFFSQSPLSSFSIRPTYLAGSSFSLTNPPLNGNYIIPVSVNGVLPNPSTGDIILDKSFQNLQNTLQNGNETTLSALFKTIEDEDIYKNTINSELIEIKRSNTSVSGKNRTMSLKSELIDFVNLNTGEITALSSEGVKFGNLNSNHFSTLEMNPATTANYSNVLMPAITTEEETKTLATLDDIPKVNPQNLEETLRAGNNSGGKIRLHDTGAAFRLSQVKPDYGENYDLGRFGTLPSQGVANTGYLMLGKEFGPNVYQTSLLPNSESTANTQLFLPKGDGTAKTLATTDEINNPVSATQSGIVDNTSLQELGGVDKLINGVRVGRGNSNGNSSTALGVNALNLNTGLANTAVGRNTLTLNTTGTFNTAVGSDSSRAITTGTQNIGIGASSLLALTTGSFNLGIGTSSLSTLLTGINNTAIGAGAGTRITGNRNTTLGYLSVGMAGASATGDYNIAIGYQTGGSLTSGSGNVLVENQTTSNSTITTGSNNVILKQGLVSTGITTGNNNTVIGNATGLPTDASNLAILSDGSGNIAIRKETDNRLLAPTLTNTLIDSGGAKSLITKEYLEEKAQIKDKQIIINGDIDVQENWNGQTIIFKSSGVVRMPIINTEEFSFNAITLEGVNLTWQWANQIEWVFGEPEITSEKKYFNLTKLGNTNQIILSV